MGALSLPTRENITERLVDHVGDTNAEHKPAPVHPVVEISMQIQAIIPRTYILLRLSCLFAGNKVKVLINKQLITHEQTAP